MTKHLISHLKQNTIAYFALFIALGGTSYASVKLPAHAQGVNARQAAHTAKAGITCGKACPAATVMWAYFSLGVPNSLAPGWGPVQTAVGGNAATLLHVGLGNWIVRFRGQPDLTNCARFANLTQVRGSATIGGYSSLNPDAGAIPVLTTDATGNPADAAFDVVVFCGGGIGATTQTAPLTG
jgi:hypothetical protein